MTLIQMAGTHLMVQLYREYLDRGCEPLVEQDRVRERDRRDRDIEQEDDRWGHDDDGEDEPPRE